ncbi:MAG: dihydropteroate synthase [Bacteroidota bacterium]|nr:dihydropteroate synthase [Bacteroidota bacterium]
MFTQKQTINLNGKLMDFECPKVMGILNITPDSFYDGGRYTTSESIKKRVKEIINEGADIIDAGGMSSRPGADIIDERTEWYRLEKALDIIRNISAEIPVSVDTFRSNIAHQSIGKYKVGMINDISGGNMDPSIFDVVAEMQVPYIMMHMQGTPASMQKHPRYKDFPGDLLEFFQKQNAILQDKNVHDVIIDPGFGFGKTLDQNYMLLHHLDRFKIIGHPVMVGISRKSMITNYLNIHASDTLPATSALHTLALMKGANILRVHDVAAAKHVTKLMMKTKNSFNANW